MEQDIWRWKVFPDQVFIAGICKIFNVTITSSPNFHVSKSHGIKNWEAMNKFPINC